MDQEPPVHVLRPHHLTADQLRATYRMLAQQPDQSTSRLALTRLAILDKFPEPPPGRAN